MTAGYSAAIVVAEAMMAGWFPNVSLLSALLRRAAGGGGPVAAELATLAALLYPCACAYYAIYKCAPPALHLPSMHMQ